MNTSDAITKPSDTRRIVVGVTGASGAPYARRLVDVLDELGHESHLVVTPYGRRLLNDECGITELTAVSLIGRKSDRLTFHSHNDLGATVSSGSFITDGMVIVPCSSNTLAAVAAGICDNLVTRAAHVHLKERRPLVIVPRETPLNRIELHNMLRLDEAGAIICPASPGFYLKPRGIDDLVDFMVGRVLDLLKIPHALAVRWDGG